jgi:hypothetical protein
MRAWSLALLLPSIALADAALIHLHAPTNPNPGLFGYDTLCHVQGQDTNTGLWRGVCTYVGYRNVQLSGIVEWDDSGAGTFIQNCRMPTDYNASHAGFPVCPAQTVGPHEQIQITYSYGTFLIPVFVQGTDTVGVMAVIFDASPRTSGLVTP